jgi:DNA-binding transcriptional regulator YiaG
LAQRQPDPALLLGARHTLGMILHQISVFVPARTHLEQGLALYNPQRYAIPQTIPGSTRNPGVSCRQPMGEITRVLSEMDRIARRGRNFGFRLISITQRPAKLNKDVLTQLSTLVALGVTSPQNRDAIKAWVDGNADREQAKKVHNSLAKLPVGEGWIWTPDHDLLEHVKFPALRTLDTSKTPKAGDTCIDAPVLVSAGLAKITKQIQAIQAAQGNNAKRTPKGTPKPPLVPIQTKPAKPRKEVTTAAPAQLGAAILAARTHAALSQIELAVRLKTLQANIVRLEKGRSLPSTRTLQRIAKATGPSWSSLLPTRHKKIGLFYLISERPAIMA